jgi:hypothetical protein
MRSIGPKVLGVLALASVACAQAPTGVRIHTDALGVVHVFADTDAGVFRGFGYSQARDFPVATLSNLWSATGRFAEVAGPLVLERDERMRQWGVDRRAHELAHAPGALEPEVKVWLEAYVEGVNAGRRLWLAPERLDALVGKERELAFDPVPSWLHPRRTQDDPRARLTRLFAAEVELEHVLALGVALAAGPEFGGAGGATRTNVWMLRGGERDATTRMLADVHQPLQEYGYRSYFVQLAGPNYDAVGLGMPGFPCVFLGASRELAFGFMTRPSKPRELVDAGLPFRIDERLPLVHGVWRGELAPDSPPRLVRGAATLPLVERPVTLRYWDVASGGLRDDPRGVRRLRWLSDADLGLELPVLEPPPDEPLELSAARAVHFEARSFLGQRSPWEAWLRLGRCARIRQALDLLGEDGYAIGRGQSCLFGDARGALGYATSVRAARVSEAALARAGEVLDGNAAEQRWRGFLGHGDGLRLVDEATPAAGKAWILCNSSPDFLGAAPSGGEPRAARGDGEPWKTRRQDRARELFERVNADGIHAREELERMALDVQDQWARASWPWLRALADGATPPLSTRARGFVEWIERFRFEGPDGKPGASEPFLAHPRSQTLPFLVLVRDRYEDELVAQRPGAAALALAFDPCAPAPSAAQFLTEEGYAPNRAALRGALEWAAELRERTLAGAPGGLANVPWFQGLAERWKSEAALFPHAFGELLSSAQANEWGADAPPVALRWGLVNVYALTPHRSTADPRMDQAREVEGWLASLFAPATLELPLAFFRRQPAVVFPIGGTQDSLFQVHRPSFRSYARALVPRGEQHLALAPVDFGSQALMLVELHADARPAVRVLPALGGTEVLAEIPELGLGMLAPFRASERFARGEWSTLETDEARLRADPLVRTTVLEE